MRRRNAGSLRAGWQAAYSEWYSPYADKRCGSSQPEGPEATKKEHITRHSLEELESKRRRGETHTDWERVDALTDREIERAFADDPDTEPLDEAWFEAAELLIPDQKKRITIRVDREVLDYFKSNGAGYQSRMNAVLKAYVARKAGRDTQ